jgi:hypothetical protein
MAVRDNPLDLLAAIPVHNVIYGTNFAGNGQSAAFATLHKVAVSKP